MIQGLGKKKDNHFFVSWSDKNVNRMKSFQFSHCWTMALDSEFQQKFITWDKGTINGDCGPTAVGNQRFTLPVVMSSYLLSSRRTLKNRNPGSYPRFWKMMRHLLQSFLTCRIPPLSFSSAQAVFNFSYFLLFLPPDLVHDLF